MTPHDQRAAAAPAPPPRPRRDGPALRALTAAALVAITSCYHAPAPLNPEGQSRWAESLRAATTSRPAATCPAQPVALPDAEAMALATHPALTAARAAARAAAAAAEVPLAREPELRVGTVRLDEVIAHEARFDVGLRARLSPPGTLDALAHAAREDARASTAEADDLALDHLATLRAAHAEALAARALVPLAAAEVTLAEARATRRERALAQGASTRLDRDRAALALDRARDGLAQAHTEADAAEAALGAALAAPAGCRVQAAGDPTASTAPAPLPPTEALVARALGQRPTVTRAAARVARAAALRFVAERERWPWFDFVQLDFEAGEGAEPTRWGLGLALTLPVFRLGGGEVEAREAEAWLARAEAERDVAAVADEVARAGLAVEAAEARLAAAREAARRSPPDTHAAWLAAAARGEADPDDVEALERDRIDLARRVVAASRAARDAWTALERALGGPPAP